MSASERFKKTTHSSEYIEIEVNHSKDLDSMLHNIKSELDELPLRDHAHRDPFPLTPEVGLSKGQDSDIIQVANKKRPPPRRFKMFPNEPNLTKGLRCRQADNLKNIDRATTERKVFNMCQRNKPIFSFTENSRKANDSDHKKLPEIVEDVHTIVEQITNCHLDKQTDATLVQLAPPTMLFDTENSLLLDFQGQDYQETYLKDEQALQNRREYAVQKRALDKRAAIATVTQEKIEKDRLNKFKLPNYFDLQEDISGYGSEDIVEAKHDWRKAFRPPTTDNDPRLSRLYIDPIRHKPEMESDVKLFRTPDKIAIKTRIENYIDQRNSNISNRITKEQFKKANAEKAVECRQEEEHDSHCIAVAEQDFKALSKDDHDYAMKTYNDLPPIYHNRTYPRNLKATRIFANRLEQKIRNEEQLFQLKSKVYLEHGKYLEEGVDTFQRIDNDVFLNSTNDQSSDYEDTLHVGLLTSSKYQLRGFHDKLSAHPRGRFHQIESETASRVPLTCLTRSDWLYTLMKSRTTKRTNCETHSEVFGNDEERQLVKISPIKEMIHKKSDSKSNPQSMRSINWKKPTYQKVRKFNLTKYLYESPQNVTKTDQTNIATEFDNEFGAPIQFEKRLESKYQDSHVLMQEKIQNRMKYLSVPCKTSVDSIWANMIEHTDSDDDWVPNPEAFEKEEIAINASTTTLPRSTDCSATPYAQDSYSLTNLRAPRFRETSLKRHPRRRRYPSYNISDSIHNEVNHRSNFYRRSFSRDPFDVPRLGKIATHKVFHNNIKIIPKTQYAKLLKARKHHQHRDKTQHKTITVNYLPQLPKYAFKHRHPVARKTEHLNHPNVNFDQNISEAMSSLEYSSVSSRSKAEENNSGSRISETISQHIPNLVRCKYRTFIRDNALGCVKHLDADDSGNVGHYPLDEQYLKQWNEELASIKSCNSSESSSLFTNFTYDSGSFLAVDDRKVPIEFITKPWVPFEKTNRARLLAEPITNMQIDNNPYFVMPFAGQKHDMRRLAQPKDRFFTDRSRLQKSVRDRLKVGLPLFNKEMIGTKEFRHTSMLATDWDNCYQHDICSRHRFQRFKRQSALAKSRAALRLKFNAFFLNEHIAKCLNLDPGNECSLELNEFKDSCLRLCTEWEETAYRQSMRKIETLKPLYERSDELLKCIENNEKKLEKLGVEIAIAESNWIQLMAYQKLHYLLKDIGWRQENDWIHRTNADSLENYCSSIANRYVTFIRPRNDDDGPWVIKAYFEESLLLKNPFNVVFVDHEAFRSAFDELQMRSYRSLLELHLAMWLMANLTQGFISFKNWSTLTKERLTESVKNRGLKVQYIRSRVDSMEEAGNKLLDAPINEAIEDEKLRTVTALCDVLYTKIIPFKDQRATEKESVIAKFGLISDLVFAILTQFDVIPANKRKSVERSIRVRKAFLLRQAKRACTLAERIDLGLENLRRNLQPPYVKKKLMGKLPRSRLKKRAVIVKEEIPTISAKEKLFYDAFSDNPTVSHSKMVIDHSMIASLEKNCIPFYYDHFLKLHDYFPQTQFVTHIESSEGAEENRFIFRDVLPDVFHNLDAWVERKEAAMRKHIQKTFYLYLD